ncbi:MAG: outer membrane protein assembly factor BamE [Pseudomonadota bacterium]|nr:outer membrane protein assembly factor BamE [Pseudomonadota bacterium]
MQYQRILLSTVVLASLGLTACTNTHIGYNVEVQQGNIITAKMANQLRVGMSREQVMSIMGEPVVVCTFNNDRWEYVYTLSKRGHALETKHTTVIFSGDRLVKIIK